MKKVLNFVVLITGFSGFCVQMLFIRELLIIFSGNELSLGIIFTNWLIFEGFGSYLAGKKTKFFLNNPENFSTLTLVFAFYIPFNIYLIRIFKNLIGISITQPFVITQILYCSFFTLFIPSLIHGALFTLSCKIYSDLLDKKEKSPGITYIYETIGTILGGLIWTYFLILHLHSFDIAFLISSLNFLISFLVLFYFSQKNNFSIKTRRSFSFLFFLFIIFSFFTKLPEKLQNITISKQWKNINIVHYKNSIYGNITVSENKGQYTFFINGIPQFSIPIPDISYVEEFVHLPLLLHPSPENVLIIGGNFEMINEILKYRTIKSIEYIEIDPILIDTIKKLPPNLIKVFENEKVKIINEDGRFYLNKTKKKYDIIFIGISEPTNLQSNRFFTREFFNISKNKLNKSGILTFAIYGSLSYQSEELNKLHKCIFETINSVFNSNFSPNYKIRVFPGVGKFLYLASENEKILWIDRIKKEKYGNSNFYLNYKLHFGWFNFYSNLIHKEKIIDINYDFKPIGVFYSISYWNTIFAPYIKFLFKLIEKMNLLKTLSFLSLIFLISIFSKNKFYKPIPFAIFSTGFSGIIYNLIIIFVFQIIYGYIFYLIGILATFFMIGSTLGALKTNFILKHYKNLKKFFTITEIIIIFYSILLPFFITLFSKFNQNFISSNFSIFIFLLFSFISGFLVGMQFPLANVIYLKDENNMGKTVGILYSSDLIGGCIGGLVGSLFFFPVLGIFNTCIIVFFLKIFSLFNLIIKV